MVPFVSVLGLRSVSDKDPLLRHNLEKLVTHADKDKDGVLNFVEFLNLMSELRQIAEHCRRDSFSVFVCGLTWFRCAYMRFALFSS